MKWLPKLFKYYLQRKFDPRAKQYFKNEKEDGFDSKYGTDTTKPMEIIEYGDVPIAKIKGRIRYRATHTEIIKKSIEVLPIIYSDFVFVDVGCGKGRPLIIASTYPFKRIEGVEISKNLCRIAEKNVKKIPKSEQRCSQLSIYCTDIISYELPSDNLILFCYNSIGGIILEHFLSNIKKSLDEISRQIYLIFIKRFDIHESLEKTSFLKKVQEVDLGEKYKKEMWNSYVYKNVL